jgi:hypothetical protein
MPGNRYDSMEVPPLIDNVEFGGLIADKTFDSKLWSQISTKEVLRSLFHSILRAH